MDNIVGVFQRIWLGLVIGLIVGLGLGLLFGWVVWPVSWTPGSDDVAAVADSFALNGDVPTAQRRLANLPKADQERIVNQLIQDRQRRGLTIEADRLTAFSLAMGLSKSPTSNVPTPAPGATPRPSTPTPTASGFDFVPILIAVFAIGLVALAGVLVFTRVLPQLRARRATRAPSAAPVAEAAVPSLGMPEAPAAPTVAAGGLGRFVPSYTLGNDNYDTSYSLETPRGEFLGECGMGISERLGEGKPDKVTAFDLWLFDKADVRTVTQILMSEHAFKDQALRAKLQTKGEAVLAEKGKVIHLETQSLGISAHIVELIYATNPSLPTNSHFQKLIVEIVPEFKTGVAPR
ncbi:MAG: hypothetical protein HY868_09270 [Chloroflexi bacterium]|nr:hypothetical protein [Chloroflexota bacterium]